MRNMMQAVIPRIDFIKRNQSVSLEVSLPGSSIKIKCSYETERYAEHFITQKQILKEDILLTISENVFW